MADGAAPPGRDFLGVARSLMGRAWRVREADPGLIDVHRRRQQLPEVAARLLAARGVSADNAARFLDPTLKAEFPDPSSFIDMDTAARVIEDAIVSGRPTAVFADYDVDGGTSAAQLARYFRLRGRELRIYVPDRMAEGYGPNAGAFETLKAEGIELVITVDCGGTAHDALNAAADIGLDVVVMDHHLMSGPPPRALAVVNPNRPDCTSGHGALTAAGVVLVAMAALNREARKRGSIGSNNLPDLLQMLDLSALGTVCDVAPLTGFNRAIVAQGLKVLARKEKAGIAALAETAGRQKLGEVYDLGFVLGPRLNAGGRIGDATLAARLLTTDDPAEAAAIAAELEVLNQQRRQKEQDMLVAAIEAAEKESRPVIVVGDPSWHPGVIGIAAGRVKERVLKPTIILGGGGNGEPAKGSGRSITGVNLGRAVAAAHGAGILRAGGGHAAAAGLTIDWERIDELRDFLADQLGAEIAAAAGEARTLWLDALASPAAVDLSLMAAIDRIGPYGAGHPEPLFAMAELRVSWAGLAKQEHVRCVLEDSSRNKLKAIAFRAAGQPLGDALMAKDRLLHVALRLKRNDFGGTERVEAEIVDAALAS
jgi:single-stranded-DNA-specific exonuclease